MINLTAMMGRITGKSAEAGQQAGGPVGSAVGASPAPGGAFAALVQRIAGAGQTGQMEQAGGAPDIEAGVSLPGGAIDPTARAGDSQVSGIAPTRSGRVTSWPQFADIHASPKAAAVPDGVRARPGVMPAAHSIIEMTAGSPAGEQVAMTLAGDGAALPTPDDERATMASADRMPADGQALAPPSVAVDAVAMAIPAPWSGPQAADGAVPPSVSGAMGDMANSDGGSLPIVIGQQVAMTTGARPMSDGTSPAQPMAAKDVMAGEIAPVGESGDKAGRDGAGSVAPASGRAGEQPAAGSVPASGSAMAGGAMPLRMIVETLPPVVQSALGAGAVATVSGASTGQQLGDQVIDMAVSGQWIDRMAREITALAEGGGHSRFTLSPPHLGRLQVDLWQGQDATSVRFLAETDEAARRLGEGRAALQTDARLVALNLGSVTIEKSAPQESPRDAGGQRPGGDTAGQAQQQAAGQNQGQGQPQARTGSGEAHGDRAGRPLRDIQDQQGDTAPQHAARRAASGHVRFA